MPLNKNFQKRITILDECFSSPTGQFTLEKLIEVIGDKLDMIMAEFKEEVPTEVEDTDTPIEVETETKTKSKKE